MFKLEEILTKKELRISELVTRGLTNDEIGEKLRPRVKGLTVRNYLYRDIFEKLGIGNRAELAAMYTDYKKNVTVPAPPRGERPDGANRAKPVARLYLLGNSRLPETISVIIQDGLFTIGRVDDRTYDEERCDFEFGSEVNYISRHHAKIEKTSSVFSISMLDPDSAGTFINGNRIEPERRYPLNNHDIVSFSAVGIDYRFEVLTN